MDNEVVYAAAIRDLVAERNRISHRLRVVSRACHEIKSLRWRKAKHSPVNIEALLRELVRARNGFAAPNAPVSPGTRQDPTA